MSGLIGGAGSSSGKIGYLAPGTTVLLFSGAGTSDHSSVNDGGLIGTNMSTGAIILPLPGNDIMIYFSVAMSTSSGNRFWATIRKNGSTLTAATANASGNRFRATITGTGTGNNAPCEHGSIMFLDVNPYTGSAITYDILVQPEPSGTVRLNRSEGNSNSSSCPRAMSSLQIFEIYR